MHPGKAAPLTSMPSKIVAPSNLHWPGMPGDLTIQKPLIVGRDFPGPLHGALISPRSQDPNKPTLLALHGDTGLTPDFLRLLSWYAAAGFTILALDLFDGIAPSNPAEAAEIWADLARQGTPRVLTMIATARAFLITQHLAPFSPVVLGWGEGGTWAMHAAATNPQFYSAAISYYGNPFFLADLTSLARPILHFALQQDNHYDLAAEVNMQTQLQGSTTKNFNLIPLIYGTNGFLEPTAQNPTLLATPIHLSAEFSPADIDPGPVVLAFSKTVQWIRMLKAPL